MEIDGIGPRSGMALQGSALAAVAVVSAPSNARPITIRIVVSRFRFMGRRRLMPPLSASFASVERGKLFPFRHAGALFHHVVPAVVVLGADVLQGVVLEAVTIFSGRPPCRPGS